eukprot:SAG25_NODE_1303_length_3350_cov_5.169904_2_plen_562_part_01
MEAAAAAAAGVAAGGQMGQAEAPCIAESPALRDSQQAVSPEAAGAASGDPPLRGQTVAVKGSPELWDVLSVEHDQVQVQLRGGQIRRRYPTEDIAPAVPSEPPIASAENLPRPCAHAGLLETRKLRVFLADTASAQVDDPVGFVMVSPSASLADVRHEIVDDELEVPAHFVFVVDGDIAKLSQEKKILADYLMQDGHVRVVPRPEAAVAGAKVTAAGAKVIMPPNDTGEDLSVMTDLPVLAGHLSKHSSLQGMFSSWQPRYFRLSNGTLSYFATPDDKVAKDKVVIDETCTCRPAGDKYKKKFCFEVCSWRGPLAVCAECEEDCELWKDYITKTVKAIQQLAAQKGIKRGLLYKRDEGLFRKWKQKWVVLNRTNLSFYETPDDPSRQKPPTDELDLVDADINATDVIIDGRSFCFIIRQPKRQSIELSTSDNSSMNDWMKMLQSNINGVQEHAVSSKKASWGVRPKRARLQKTGAGWFQSGRVQEVTVIESRQTRIDGEKTTEYFLHVQHKTGLAWCISRQLQDILDLHATFNNTDPKKYEFLDTFIQGPRDNKAKKLTTAE